MSLFRKKPVVIEAEQFTEERALECLDQGTPFAFGLIVSGFWYSVDKKLYSASLHVETPEGIMRAELGDWIIKGVKGELYPCKPDVFGVSYEPVAAHNPRPPGEREEEVFDDADRRAAKERQLHEEGH